MEKLHHILLKSTEQYLLVSIEGDEVEIETNLPDVKVIQLLTEHLDKLKAITI